MTQLLRYAPQSRKRKEPFLPVMNAARLFARVTGQAFGGAKGPLDTAASEISPVRHGDSALVPYLRRGWGLPDEKDSSQSRVVMFLAILDRRYPAKDEKITGVEAQKDGFLLAGMLRGTLLTLSC